MTIAICLKVGDGLVLGADSAASLMSQDLGVQNVYTHAEKIANLRKGLPIGMATYGLGGLAGRSVSRLAKDLRGRLSDKGDWTLDPDNYTVEDVARHVRAFFYDELYAREFQGIEKCPPMGFIVAGFSAGVPTGEAWSVEINDKGECSGPDHMIAREKNGAMSWRGQGEALCRLIRGFAPKTHQRFVDGGMDPNMALGVLAAAAPLANSAMPIQDAIDLVSYLADVTCGYMRFVPGPPTVAPPIDIAAITLHERFRWVKRKHYYTADLNPPPELDPERRWSVLGREL